MGKRRFALAVSDDEEDEAPARPGPAPAEEEEEVDKRKAKKKLSVSSDEDEEREGGERSEEEDPEEEEEEEAEQQQEEEAVGQEEEEAKPVGEVVRVTGKGRWRKNHYNAFDFDGTRYELEDPVLLSPEESKQKPYVAIIKDISQKLSDESLMLTGQWFYRPEEAERKGGGNWQSSDTRELFYSFHRDDIPAESVMHKCVVHFIPLNKQIPRRKQHPGFVVQKVYDTEQRRLFKLTDKDYEDNKQQEIDVLVNKTIARIGELPDIETEDTLVEHGDQLKAKRAIKRRMSLLDVSRDDDTKFSQSLKPETPGSVTSNNLEYYISLSNSKALTGDAHRDKWLDRLLQDIHFIFGLKETAQSEDKDKSGSRASKGANGSEDGAFISIQDGLKFVWPDDVVPFVRALEKAAHEAFSSDFLKYNQKMRSLSFNLKSNSILARRLLKGELEPSKILSMSPNELKEGLTAEELASKQPEESARMQPITDNVQGNEDIDLLNALRFGRFFSRLDEVPFRPYVFFFMAKMTDARCKRCSEKKVVLTDIIQTGHGDRYQLECTACGNSWYAFRDEVSTLTIEAPNSAKSVGTAPLATAKFENVEKKLVSPRELDKSSANDVFKKSTEAYMPVLETQKSLKKALN